MNDIEQVLSELEPFGSDVVADAFIKYFTKDEAISILSKVLGGSISESQRLEELLKDF